MLCQPELIQFMSFRLDRLLTLGCFNPLRKAQSGAGQGRLPVLMYHSISDGSEDNVSPYYRTTTSPRVFAEQMMLLRDEGFRAVSLRQGRELLRRGRTDADKAVAVTFDDGFRDFYSQGFPVLRQHGFSATMFLPTAFIGNEVCRFKERECMTWGEVRELHRAGIEFGSHTVHHPKLYELDFTQIRTELEVSKSVIEEKLGAAISSFAYPYAFPSADRPFVETLTGLLKGAGYECNATTRIGRVRVDDDPFTLKRLPVNSADDGALLLAKIRGAYDWMNRPQAALKKLKTFAASGRGRTQPRLCRAP
ncbi:MAG: Polysaccharide deacetylase [Pedosphaera sp.]|nr:Polysaccharide deacetylase [Pedosphaera sp.]